MFQFSLFTFEQDRVEIELFWVDFGVTLGLLWGDFELLRADFELFLRVEGKLLLIDVDMFTALSVV